MRGIDAWIDPPFSKGDSKSLEGGEPIVNWRVFDGVPERSSYFELSQRFAHVMGLHHMPERQAWCRLDAHGDIKDVVRIVDLPARRDGYLGRVILCDRATLARYAELSGMAFVQLFDITYFEPGNFTSWHQDTYKPRTFGDSPEPRPAEDALAAHCECIIAEYDKLLLDFDPDRKRPS